jgi:hypothetical protein
MREFSSVRGPQSHATQRAASSFTVAPAHPMADVPEDVHDELG